MDTLTAPATTRSTSIAEGISEYDQGVFNAAYALDAAVAALPDGTTLIDLDHDIDGFGAPLILATLRTPEGDYEVCYGPDWKANLHNLGPFPMTAAYHPRPYLPGTTNLPEPVGPLTARRVAGAAQDLLVAAATTARDQVLLHNSHNERRRPGVGEDWFDTLADAVRRIARAAEEEGE